MKKFFIRALGVFILLVSVRAATSSIAPLINNLLVELDFTNEKAAIVAGIILALGYVASIIGSTVGGRIADMFGSVKTFLTAGFVFAGVFILWSFTTQQVLFYVYRAILALCTGSLYVALQSYLLGGTKRGSEGMAMGVYGLGFGIGTAIAGSVAGMAGGFGISQAFFILGIVCAVACVVCAVVVAVDKKIDAPYEVAISTKVPEGMSVWKILKNANSTVYFLLLIAFAYGFGTIIFLQYVDELGALRGIAGTKASFGIAVFSIVQLLQPLSGMLSDKIGRAKCILLGMVLVFVGWTSIALFAGSLGMILLFSGVAGIGALLYTPASFALAQKASIKGSGGLMRGLFQGATAIGTAIAAMFGAVIYSSFGISNVFYILVGATVLSLVSAIILNFVAKKGKDQQEVEAKG